MVRRACGEDVVGCDEDLVINADAGCLKNWYLAIT